MPEAAKGTPAARQVSPTSPVSLHSVALEWQHTKRLMRLQGMAEELLAATQRVKGAPKLNSVSGRISDVVEQVKDMLRDVDPQLAREFEREIAPDPFRRGLVAAVAGAGPAAAVEAQAAALVGWLRGVVEAETFEGKMREEARAYAEARVREERPVGFGTGERLGTLGLRASGSACPAVAPRERSALRGRHLLARPATICHAAGGHQPCSSTRDTAHADYAGRSCGYRAASSGILLRSWWLRHPRSQGGPDEQPA